MLFEYPPYLYFRLKGKYPLMIELAAIVVLGILAQWIAWKAKVPAILPLILIGMFVGPFSPYWYHGDGKWLEPIWDNSHGHGLFPGEGLFHFVELAIGIILFEGGLTLKTSEFKDVGSSILRLISVGSLVTFIGGGLAAHFLIDLPWALSFLFSGLIIVTGPTVIAPILRNVPLKKHISAVLKWEGILIDPVGALVAVLVYEFISKTGSGGEFTQEALIQFLQIVFVATSWGGLTALALREMLKRDWVPHYLLTIFTLAFVLFVFVGSSIIVHDSGLLAVVVAGMVLGNMDVPHINEITYFKESLSILLISILFILLSANIDLKDLELLMDWRCISLFFFVILILRPAAVLLSTQNSKLTLNEKLFISWMGPRGIVAAGIASLFGLKLVKQGFEGAEYITPLVFMIVLGTVLLNATTAKLIGGLLGVLLKESSGMLIFGATKASRLIAKYLQDNGQHVVVVDRNDANIKRCAEEGLEAFSANIYTDDLSSKYNLFDMGYMLAMMGNAEVNRYAMNKFKEEYGENGAVRLIASDERKYGKDKMKNLDVLNSRDDFINLSEVARDFPSVQGVTIDGSEDLLAKFDQLMKEKDSIPLFIKSGSNSYQFIPQELTVETSPNVDELVYLGKKLEFNPPQEKVEQE